jgi:hypothetical protein
MYDATEEDEGGGIFEACDGEGRKKIAGDVLATVSSTPRRELLPN